MTQKTLRLDNFSCDLNTSQGQEYAKRNKVKENICEKFVTDSIEIVEALIK